MLRDKVSEVLRAVSHLAGVSRAFIDRAGEVPQLQIEVDRGRAARYGLNVADVQDVVETALGGKVGTHVFEVNANGAPAREREERKAVRVGEVELDIARVLQ